MTGRWAGFGLRVDLGDPARPWVPRTPWLRPPSADYRCPCGWQAHASGDAVPRFAATVQAEHAERCPLPGGLLPVDPRHRPGPSSPTRKRPRLKSGTSAGSTPASGTATQQHQPRSTT